MTLESTKALRAVRRRIGANIHARRAERKMKLAELSRASGIGVEELDAFELGKREIRLEHIARIAATLDVPMETLLDGEISM